ncbi:MAG: insulinase family protein [Bacteroidetes bacterium]|nr:insulinase family protein [Bacteroidota bacterium]MCW5896141.1 insulinase family protein [Bacteroidota bacterium]
MQRRKDRPPGLPPAGLRRLFSAVLTLGAILMLTTAQTDAQTKVSFEQYTLDNGLTVILHEDHSAPVAAVVAMYNVGSKNEKKGRTGFAHLFEHMMFQGSQHVADDEHFKLLQEVGGNINGTTSNDRTNYFEVVPSNYLELALYLESDRMGFLLPAMTQEKLDNQRDVVKNERRQNVDNQPYGTAWEKIAKAIYPEEHPYSWPVIGYMEDLSAATLEDVMEFFRIYYAPNNAVLSIAGDFKPAQAKEWVKKYFGSIPRGTEIPRPSPMPVTLSDEKRMVFEDKVQLPRLYLRWPSAPLNTREDAVLDVIADILGAGKNSRLYKTLVYERQVAQSVNVFQASQLLSSQFSIEVTAKPGKSLTEMEAAVNDELAIFFNDGVTEKEIQTSINHREAGLTNSLATVLGKANSLATYFTFTGDPNNINKEFDRYKGITPAEVLAVAKKILGGNKVALSIVPEGKVELAAEKKTLERKGGVE